MFYQLHEGFFMKKFTNLTLKSVVILVAISLSLFFAGCSKEGPAGVAGKDANITCGVCHADNATDVNLKFTQYDLSKHGTGIIFEEEAGRVQCGACHTGLGFIQSLANNDGDALSDATGKITCTTCHKIHTKYDFTDFALRFSGDLTMRVNNFKETTVKGAGALCIHCHQGRAYTRGAQADTVKATVGTTFSRFGPHYGTIGNIFTENGPYKIDGPEPYPTTLNKHATLEDGCVSCHLGKLNSNPAIGQHTFVIPLVTTSGKLYASNFKDIAECQVACHDATFFTTALPKANEVKTMLAEYRDTLIARKWLDITQTANADGTYNKLGEYMAATSDGKNTIYKKDDASVILNYLYLVKEKSFGVHNPKYVYALVKNGLAYLKK
jgi:hypothetical protein